MHQPQTLTAANEIPRLLQELRDHIVRKTGKPIDPDVDFLTTQIELLSTVQADPISGVDLYGFSLTESRIFNALATQKGRILSRGALMTAAYYDRPHEEPEPKIIDVFALHIRRKLIRADARVWVESVRGIGMRLVDKIAREAQVAKHNG